MSLKTEELLEINENIKEDDDFSNSLYSPW